MTIVGEVLRMLEERADPGQLAGMERFSIETERRMGVNVPDIRAIAKQVGTDHYLALGLWQTGITEARIVASLVDDPRQVTEHQMEEWVADFHSWDLCDQVCMNLFDKTPFVRSKIHEWSTRQPEFEKRAAFALIAVLAWRDKAAPDEDFLEFLLLVRAGADDARNFVRKAVSWALRNIGKRSPFLRQEVLAFLPQLEAMQDGTAAWVARDTRKDLNSPATLRRMAKLEK